ncbi:hypothetical protein PGT21_016852 [Puccinia graminis f. sp. tritici]|uniref:Uncharacterized protein n=1 Tax=Puccinia graminis f. sp. tritici TaxID=56615 RepID=A0A5B0MSP8_PUCGR|nr:hypothetical protein PGT21_016852 [Puccinia graminis f. sp. tritici]
MPTRVQVGFLGRPDQQIAYPNPTHGSYVPFRVGFGSLNFPSKSAQTRPKSYRVSGQPRVGPPDYHPESSPRCAAVSWGRLTRWTAGFLVAGLTVPSDCRCYAVGSDWPVRLPPVLQSALTGPSDCRLSCSRL